MEGAGNKPDFGLSCAKQVTAEATSMSALLLECRVLQRKTPDREKNVLLLIQIKAIPCVGSSTATTQKNSRSRSGRQEQIRETNMAMMSSMSSTDHGTTCVKCGEMLFIPDWSEFVSERLVVNLWSCGRCGDRFETLACMSVDAEFNMSEKDWERMFPPLLVA